LATLPRETGGLIKVVDNPVPLTSFERTFAGTVNVKDYLPAEYFINKNRAYKTTRNKGTVEYDEPKTGRNEPCPCGSGKKYKKCCGR